MDLKTNKKNEWAGIYGNMKRESEDLKGHVRMLNQENERLNNQLLKGGSRAGAPGGSDPDLVKRLKKRELECSALWDTLRDMYSSQKKSYTTQQMLDLLQKRALNTKAQRKLGI